MTGTTGMSIGIDLLQIGIVIIGAVIGYLLKGDKPKDPLDDLLRQLLRELIDSRLPGKNSQLLLLLDKLLGRTTPDRPPEARPNDSTGITVR